MIAGMKNIGRYEIMEELGRGAMGVVYKASDPRIGRHVAIKVISFLPAKGGETSDARKVFMREVRAAGRLSHPGIVTVHDALEDVESGSAYIVMELVPGRTLDSAVTLGQPMAVEQAVDIARQLAEALDYAHRQSVIHRDLKPANILLAEGGRAKIMDFGIAKVTSREGSVRTPVVLGTPSYMSPEQVTGKEVDARSDLFSLGIILYLLLTGQKPFVGDTAAVMFKIAYEDPVSPSQANPRLTAHHDYLVLRCLVKDRDKRYSSAREFLDDLDDVQRGRPPRSKVKFPAAELRTAEPTLAFRRRADSRPSSTAATPREKPTRVAATAGAALMVLISVAGIGVWGSRNRRLSKLPASVAPAAPAVQEGKSDPVLALPADNSRVVATTTAPDDASPDLSHRPPSQGGSAKSRPAPAQSSARPAGVVSRSAESEAGASLSAGDVTQTSRTVQVVCHHRMRDGTIMILAGGQTIAEWQLRGTKRGILPLKGAYMGTLARSLRIPAGTRELSVHVLSRDGSLDLSQTISANPPSDGPQTLQVVVSPEQVILSWEPGSSSAAAP